MEKKIRFWNDLSVYNFSGERDPEKRVRFDESVVKSEDGKNWRQRERERERESFFPSFKYVLYYDLIE